MAKKQIEETQVVVKKEYWENSSGKLVPIESIEPEDQARDAFVTQIISDAIAFQAETARVKADFANRIEAFLNGKAMKVTKKPWEGNATITDFSGLNRIIRKIGKFMVFDENLNLAKQIIDECVIQWGANSNSNLVAMVNMAFNVNNAGAVDREAILSLKKLPVDGPTKPRWQEAMDLITKSQQTQATKEYFFFQTREPKEEWVTIVMDFSSIGKRNVVEKEKPATGSSQPQGDLEPEQEG